MRLTTLAGFVLLATSSAASPTFQDYVLHEKRDAAPRHWVKRSRIESKSLLPMRIGLTQSNLDQAEDLLMEVSDPHSPKYGKHYTAEEVIELFAPAKEAVEATIAWLISSGIPSERISQSANKQWIQFDSEAEEAERLLKTEYYSWEHVPSGKTHPACDEYHLPKDIQQHVDYVTPGLKLLASVKGSGNNAKAKRNAQPKSPGTIHPILGPVVNLNKDLFKQQAPDNCDTMITPGCILALYNITKPKKAMEGNELGLFEEGDYYSASDLSEFFQQLAPQIPNTETPEVKGIDGGTAPMAFAGGESNLDLMISYPIIYPQSEIIFQTDDIFYAQGLEGNGGFLNTFLDAIDGSYCTYKRFGLEGDSNIDPVYPNPNPAGYQGQRQCGIYKPTNVISISYGEQEADIPTNYYRRQCAEFLKLGLQGTSVVFASGDSGVAGRGNSADGNTNGCLGPNGEVFSPAYPASCPFITSIGSTYLPEGADVNKDEEIATTRFPSGGGFSNIFARPKYQRSTVRKYFENHDPGYPFYKALHTHNPSAAKTGNGIYNRKGRAYPDAAAVGDNVVIILNGTPTLVGGTSASAPVFAAMLNRINEERLAKGKSTVGFVNPTLYQNPQMFHDITTGTNPGCGTNGFSCAEGWDPVSGLGTPNYPAMLKVFQSLP